MFLFGGRGEQRWFQADVRCGRRPIHGALPSPLMSTVHSQNQCWPLSQQKSIVARNKYLDLKENILLTQKKYLLQDIFRLEHGRRGRGLVCGGRGSSPVPFILLSPHQRRLSSVALDLGVQSQRHRPLWCTSPCMLSARCAVLAASRSPLGRMFTLLAAIGTLHSFALMVPILTTHRHTRTGIQFATLLALRWPPPFSPANPACVRSSL